jgi:hypothetical protein
MNRERAETFLRLLAEAELRDQAVATPLPGRPADAPFPVPIALPKAAWALIAVGALDPDTAHGILADAELALAARQRTEPAIAVALRQSGPSGPRMGPSRWARASLMTRVRRQRSPAEAAAPAEPRDGPDRYVPLGFMILFHDETLSGELNLMSYAHTASGARLVATWQTRDPMGARRHGVPPVKEFTVTDDRGQRYGLLFDTKGRPDSTCDLILRPDPPTDARWLEVTAPGEQAVRVDLDHPADGRVLEVSDLDRSAGEHLLDRIAERLLTMTPEFAPQVTPPFSNLAAGLGAAVGALEAAEVLSPLSPVPGRLAALCASLRVSGHGITAAPAPDLPEPWLSMLAHYHRRKPDAAPVGDGFAAAAAALPELDGIKLVLLGLHNCDGSTWMNALTIGSWVDRPERAGPLGLEAAFPLSIWVRDGAGRWHVARATGWHLDDGEAELTLRLTPPLAWRPDRIEVLVAGQSAEVRATLPLSWGYSQ